MEKPVFRFDDPVTLIGAGGASASVLALARAFAPRVVAVDGGADVALGHDVMPERVIGDLDSLSAQARQAVGPARLTRISEQDSTDFDKALRTVQAPMMIGVGFNGDRLDHMLACFNVLTRRPWKRCILLTEHQIILLCPPAIDLDLPPGSLVSLFPMGQVTGQSSGLEWPIDGLPFAPDGRVGTSNRALGPVRLDMHAPAMLLILPLAALAAAVRGLRACDGWPVP